MQDKRKRAPFVLINLFHSIGMEKDEPEAIVIENPAAAKAYKSYFDFMWKHSKSIK